MVTGPLYSTSGRVNSCKVTLTSGWWFTLGQVVYLGLHKDGPFHVWRLMLSYRGPNHVFLFFPMLMAEFFWPKRGHS